LKYVRITKTGAKQAEEAHLLKCDVVVTVPTSAQALVLISPLNRVTKEQKLLK